MRSTAQLLLLKPSSAILNHWSPVVLVVAAFLTFALLAAGVLDDIHDTH